MSNGITGDPGSQGRATSSGGDGRAVELRGAPVAKAICAGLAPRVEALVASGVTPRLAIVRVGENPGDLAYERGARSRMDKVGVACDVSALPANVSQAELEGVISSYAADPLTHGILLLRPLPREMDEDAVVVCVPGAKDVDGMTPASLASTFLGKGEGFAPCTAEAVVRLLDHYEVPLEGARCVVVGRSLVVGRPLSQLLLSRNATVTVCHSRTRDLAAACREADVLVSCMGRAHSIARDMVSGGAVVVDVGTNDDGAGGITGDVDFDAVSEVVRAITPVPGGVGSVTTSVLASHVVEAAERTLG